MAGGGGLNPSELPPWKDLAPYLTLGGLASTVLGLALIWDDIKDFGLFSTPDHPSPLHHWQYGLILFLAGLTAMSVGVMGMLAEHLKLERNFHS